MIWSVLREDQTQLQAADAPASQAWPEVSADRLPATLSRRPPPTREPRTARGQRRPLRRLEGLEPMLPPPERDWRVLAEENSRPLTICRFCMAACGSRSARPPPAAGGDGGYIRGVCRGSRGRPCHGAGSSDRTRARQQPPRRPLPRWPPPRCPGHSLRGARGTTASGWGNGVAAVRRHSLTALNSVFFAHPPGDPGIPEVA